MRQRGPPYLHKLTVITFANRDREPLPNSTSCISKTPKISQEEMASSERSAGMIFPMAPPRKAPEISTGSKVSPGNRAETLRVKAAILPKAKISR